MANIFPVTHSILSVEALITDLLPNYDIETPIDCRFLQPGLNDTFLVNTQGAKYILRVYRKDWRSLSDINYELEVLLHLQRASVAVSVPIVRKDGNFIGSIVAPEGLRYVVLFTYAPGKQPNYEAEKEQEAYLYGKAVAKIHDATDTFQSSYYRFTIDLDYLLDAPMRSIQPFLDHRLADWEYLTRLSEQLQRKIRDLPPNSLDLGFCHGDFHTGNVHIDLDKQLTFFDFDCCGISWRSYDIAVFRWGSRFSKKDMEKWPSFLSGYTEERHLSDLDLQFTTYFLAIRHFWSMGINANNGYDWGFSWATDGYFDRQIKFFREWEAEYLTD
jgi:Ser/Thr protein kinase RdoA (MazF antagonist)